MKKIKKTKEIECSYCKNKPSFFHSGCCGVHFEGVVTKNGFNIACEKCGKYSGSLFFEESLKNKKYKLK